MSNPSLRKRQQGTQNRCAKLNESKVREIRALRGTMTQAQIAKLHHVSVYTVSEIQNRHAWKHVE